MAFISLFSLSISLRPSFYSVRRALGADWHCMVVFGTIFWLCFTDFGRTQMKKKHTHAKQKTKRNIAIKSESETKRKQKLKRMYHWLWRAYLIYVTVCFFFVLLLMRATAFDSLAFVINIWHHRYLLSRWYIHCWVLLIFSTIDWFDKHTFYVNVWMHWIEPILWSWMQQTRKKNIRP